MFGFGPVSRQSSVSAVTGRAKNQRVKAGPFKVMNIIQPFPFGKVMPIIQPFPLSVLFSVASKVQSSQTVLKCASDSFATNRPCSNAACTP